MPAASDPSSGLPSLPRTWRPMGVRIAVIGFGVMLFVVCAAAWFGFPQDVRDRFNILQRITLLVLGGGFVTIGWALGRARVTAEMGALVVVNGFRRRRLAWQEVLAIHLPPGAPWATLDLADGTTLSAMAFQGSDGKVARDGVRQVRALIDRADARDN
ncbi:PH domain-containing protein [Nocardioides hwasunensis]|uniref:PH domain-containing protein n=1 Tax=Nocardioides hwasunensis TaxID=397258 RepID=A0ABR8MC77_9ACTN|nr:PH domain-containing protein [Nocardioides hwasunensis]MBD3913745.1 PH domain-containing protein [Nocardioides hwasunensis]